MIPLRTRVVAKNEDMRVAPRCLPYFIQKKLRDHSYSQAIQDVEGTK